MKRQGKTDMEVNRFVSTAEQVSNQIHLIRWDARAALQASALYVCILDVVESSESGSINKGSTPRTFHTLTLLRSPAYQWHSRCGTDRYLPVGEKAWYVYNRVLQ